MDYRAARIDQRLPGLISAATAATALVFCRAVVGDGSWRLSMWVGKVWTRWEEEFGRVCREIRSAVLSRVCIRGVCNCDSVFGERGE